MSLLNLKKSKPSAKPSLRSVEAFIDDALLYAQGKSKRATKNCVDVAGIINDDTKTKKHVVVSNIKLQRTSAMRRATFTLTHECIEKLSVLSRQTGKAKSALIREWIHQHTETVSVNAKDKFP